MVDDISPEAALHKEYVIRQELMNELESYGFKVDNIRNYTNRDLKDILEILNRRERLK